MNTSTATKSSHPDLAPHDVDAERALLGSILDLNVKGYEMAAGLYRVKPEDFFIVRHQWIYEAMGALVEKGSRVNFITVEGVLTDSGRLDDVGDKPYIRQLQNAEVTPTPLDIDAFASRVRQMAIRRRFLSAASKIAQLAHSASVKPSDLYQKVMDELDDVGSTTTARPYITAKSAVSDALDRYKQAADEAKDGTPRRGIPTGFKEFDDLLRGEWDVGKFMLLFGATGLGKTTLACNLVPAMAAHVPILFVTLEMAPQYIIDRIVAGYAEVPESHARQGKLKADTWFKLMSKTTALSELPWTVTGACHTADQIAEQCFSMTDLYGGRRGIVIIDTLNSLEDAGYSDNQYQRITNAVRALDFKVKLRTGWGVVGLGQQRLDIDVRASIPKQITLLRPNLGNIQNSRELAQKAEFMVGIYNWVHWERQIPGYVDLAAHERGYARLDMLKSRYGDAGYCTLRWLSGFPAFKPNDWQADTARPAASVVRDGKRAAAGEGADGGEARMA